MFITSFRKLLSILVSTSFLISFNIIPANGATIVPCTGVGSSGSFSINSNVVTGNTDCVGEVIIPSGVLSIGNNAFFNNLNITSVNIPDSVLTIGATSFTNLQRLTTLTIGNNVTDIGNSAFEGAFRLTTLVIPDSVVTIGSAAFSGTNALTSLTLGNQLTTIGQSAFSGANITRLVIPNSVTIIGTRAFSGSPLNSLELGNSVTTISEQAFEDSVFSSVTLPATLNIIGDLIFRRNTSLVNVNFLGNAPTFSSDPFYNIGSGAKAYVAYNATGFGANGSIWNRLIVTYGSAPSSDSGSSTAPTISTTATKTPDAVFNLKNKKYLSKNAMKTKLNKNKSFKRNPEDLYKYSIFGTSKRSCVMRENYVMALKETGACELWVARNTTKGTKYKYWVKINYVK